MSISRTSEAPSAMAGLVVIGVVIPRRRAMLATVPKPTSSASRTAAVLMESAKAWRTGIGPEPEPRGLQPLMVIGLASTLESGV
jgi:hypothetical protein